MEMNIEEITYKLNLNPSKILNCYLFGSRIYKTNSESSDYDFIVVYENSNNEILEINNRNKVHNATNEQADGVWSEDELFQSTLYSKSEFIKKNHTIHILECLFLPKEYKLKETINFLKYFTLDLDLLRRNISHVCENSFVKAKKKMEVEWKNDLSHPKSYYDYIGKKSLFHSLRIGFYGIQIAKYGKIIDYINLNENYSTTSLWNEINIFNSWNELKEKYQTIANNLRTEFRLVAPLKEEI